MKASLPRPRSALSSAGGEVAKWSAAAVFGLVVSLLVFSPAAGAAVYVTEGFESDCSGVPCGWSSPVGVTLARDTTTFHGGAASMRVTTTQTGVGLGAGQCIPNVTAGSYPASVWYRTDDPNATEVRFQIGFYDGISCTDFITSSSLVASPPALGGWQQLTGTVTAPVGSDSAFLSLQVDCACSEVTANFDDLVFGGPPTAVVLRSFAATRAARGVLLRWHIGSQVGLLGFNVYREEGGTRVRLNRGLILALRRKSGSSYRFPDTLVAKRISSVRYWFETVDADGSRSWHGPVRVSR